MIALPKRVIWLPVLLLSLLYATSCAEYPVPTQEQPSETTQQTVPVTQTPTRPDKPIKSEMDMLQQYHDIVKFLHEYDGPSHEWVYIDNQSYVDQAALVACRTWLLEHPEVDIWEDFIPTYWSDDFNWNRLELLDKFSSIEDVPIRDDYTDYSSDTDPRYAFGLSEYGYDIEGRLTRRTNINTIWELIDQDVADNHYHACYMYDENGVLQQIVDVRYLDEPYRTVRTAQYDEQGRLTGFLLESENESAEITYTYDEEGRIISIRSPEYAGSNNYTEALYFYDDADNMIREEKCFYRDQMAWPEEGYLMSGKTVTEYTYDENGLLRSGVKTQYTWDHGSYYDNAKKEYVIGYYLRYKKVDTYAFEFDDRGRLLSVLIEYGDSYHMSGKNEGEVASEPADRYRLMEVIYGTYWFYNGK